MTTLIRMRLQAYLRSQVSFAPMLAALVILGILYGGGQAAPTEAYGISAVVLFPVLAWQVKILLDVEPDVQRRIAATAVGSRGREVAAGLLAAAITAGPTIVAGLALPWLVGGVSMSASPVSLGAALLSGLWAHLVAVPPALALGALASRAVSRTAGNGVVVLITGFVLAIVIGLKDSPVPWLMFPLMPTSRAVVSGITVGQAAVLTLWAVAWTAAALSGYARLRRTRP
ncbi:MAG TPA: hypothetical protein VFO41_13810 [Alphaproteobacteria bacterium]|nr:hypothetical protein [Alphaproteobacteria bacterium]